MFLKPGIATPLRPLHNFDPIGPRTAIRVSITSRASATRERRKDRLGDGGDPGGLRVVFEVPRPSAPLELRCVLRAGTETLSETWSYQLQPRGEKWYAIPWNALHMERNADGTDLKQIVLDVNKETLERAPAFTRDRWPDTRDNQWTRDTQKYWSDTTITASVKSKLAREKASTLTKVNVDTRQGVVELNGTVDNNAMKQRAADLAQQVDGVRRVVNNLKVQGS
jgi:hypothetical protein